MGIKIKIICVQFIVISILTALLFNLNQKPQIISPLAKQPVQVLSEKISQKTSSKIPLTTSPTSTNTPTPSPTVTPSPTLTPTPFPTLTFLELEEYFDKYSNQFSVAKDLVKRIASCESGFNPSSTNGDYLGMFQFSTQTWISNRINLGADPNPELRLNAEESIKTASFMIARNLTKAWPNCSK